MKNREGKMPRQMMNPKGIVSDERLREREAKRRAQELENEAPSDVPASKRRKTSSASEVAGSEFPEGKFPPSDAHLAEFYPGCSAPSGKCLADKTNCLDRTALVVKESGDDCHDDAKAAAKSGDDSFQLKVCRLCLLRNN